MFRGPTPVTDPPSDLTAASTHDTCVRCGRPTPLGVSLCEQDNPGRIKSPSSTQVHGTIVIGVLAGFLLLALLLRFGAAGVGPFSSTLAGVATRADGGLDVVVQVANGGTRASGASCRISAGGAPDFRDYVFFSEPIPAGETRTFTRSVPPHPRWRGAVHEPARRPLQLAGRPACVASTIGYGPPCSE